MAFRFMVNLGFFNVPLLRKPFLVFVAAAFAFGGSATAASISLVPAADTSLMEVAPSNNNGGQAWILCGTTQNGTRNRALLTFDLSSLPSNGMVVSAALSLSVIRQPSDGFADAAFSLHRMLVPWGEGTNASTVNPGRGSPAIFQEATWLHAAYPAALWADPGGASGTDFSPWESSFQVIYGTSESPYQFPSTPELISDVQAWIDRSLPNHGWLLLCNSEATLFTARQLGSREHPSEAPVLNIEYLVPPVPTSWRVASEQFFLSFTAEAGQRYSLESKPDLVSTNWQVLNTVAAPAVRTNITLSGPALSPRAFYCISTTSSQ